MNERFSKRENHCRWLEFYATIVCNHHFPTIDIFLKPYIFCGMPPKMSTFVPKSPRQHNDINLGD